MVDKSMKQKRSAHFFSHMIKVGFAVLALTFGVLGFCAAPAAAEPSVGNYLFYYENITGSTGTYMSQGEVLVLDGINVLDYVNLYPEGTYINTMPTPDYDAFVLKKLDASVVMKVYDEDNKVIYNGIDGTVLQGSRVSFEVVLNMPTIKYHQSTKDSSLPYVGLRFINPRGDIISSRLGSVDYGAESPIRWDINKLDDNLMVGEWTVQAFFVPKNEPGFFAPYTRDEYLYGSSYSFTVVTPSAKRLIPLAVEIIEGNYANVELESVPRGVDTISVENGILPAGQLNVDYFQSANGIYKITVPPSGVSIFAVQSTNSNDLTVSLLNKNGEVETSTTIRVKSEAITAEIDKESLLIGKSFNIHGNHGISNSISLFIEGTDLEFMKINGVPAAGDKWDRYDWNFDVSTSEIRDLNGGVLESGTYTIYAVSIPSLTPI